MEATINLEKLSEKTEKYQAIINERTADLEGIRILDLIRRRLLPTIESLIITNYQKNKRHDVFYVIKLHRNHIELVESNITTKSHFLFLFFKQDLFFNRNKVGKIHEKMFRRRLHEIMKDIREGNAFIFEEVPSQ